MFKLISVLVLIFSFQVPAPEIIAKPIPFTLDSVQSHFKAPLHRAGPGHRGIDLAVDQAGEIYSPFSGEVFFSDLVVNRPVVTVVSKTGLKASFEPVCGAVRKGEAIQKGDLIGHRCPGTEDYREHCPGCVHFSVRNDHGYLNPLLYFGMLQPPRLTS